MDEENKSTIFEQKSSKYLEVFHKKNNMRFVGKFEKVQILQMTLYVPIPDELK